MEQLTEQQKKIRTYLIITAFILFVVFVLGMFFLAVSDIEKSAILTLSFVAGLSMIFLPCTLPLVFVIVPLSMGSNYKKGLLIALLFALGLSTTLSIYGIGIAYLGSWLGLETSTEIMFIIAGAAAFIFGLTELGFVKLRIPGYGGKVPDFIQKQGDYVKSFFLGLFLGNAGVGCPNPAFYILLTYIATVGNVAEGWYLGFIHGVGRSIPLIFLAILGILGVNASGWIVNKKQKVESFIGWALTYIGAFIFMNGVFGHDWYVQSGIHGAWEKAIAWIFNNIGGFIGIGGLGGKFGELIEHHHDVISSPFYRSGNWVLVALFSLPLVLNYFAKKKELKSFASQPNYDQTMSAVKKTDLNRMIIKYIILILIFIGLFVGYFPGTVLPKTDQMTHIEEPIIKASGGYNRDIEINKYNVQIGLSQEKLIAGQPFEIKFTVLNKENGQPITDLAIVHEKPMHVILIRDDLTEFAHFHPDLAGASYSAVHSLAMPGFYKGWVDFSYKGETNIADFLIETENAERLIVAPELISERNINNYTVSLMSENLVRGKNASLHISIKKDGREVEPGELLGSKGHLIAISSDLKDFIHTHSEDGMMENHQTGIINNAALAHGGAEEEKATGLHYNLVFNQSGAYKLWLETMVDGQYFKADFMVNIQ